MTTKEFLKRAIAVADVMCKEYVQLAETASDEDKDLYFDSVFGRLAVAYRGKQALEADLLELEAWDDES